MSKEMTREEVMEYLNTLYMALAVFPNQQISLGNIDKMKESVSTAIEALEQEPILDKIRAEIMGMYREILKGTSEDDWILTIKWNHCLDEVLQIIDKYKAESEGEEG